MQFPFYDDDDPDRVPIVSPADQTWVYNLQLTAFFVFFIGLGNFLSPLLSWMEGPNFALVSFFLLFVPACVVLSDFTAPPVDEDEW